MLVSLSDVRKLVEAAIRQDDFPNEIPMPLLREAVLEYPSRAGKSMRSALLIWCCGLFGGDTAQCRRVAAAVELYHLWTLVHDDIIDEDELRRNGPTIHAWARDRLLRNGMGATPATAHKFGITMGILAGDVIHGWANKLVAEAHGDGLSPELVLRILHRLNGHVTPRLITGEALDVELAITPVRNRTAGPIRTMLHLKTGVLFRFAAEAGAMIGLNTVETMHEKVRLVGDFAEHAAFAFQVRDDLLGIVGNVHELGKPIGSDIRQGKSTLLTVLATQRLCGAELDRFQQTLGNRDATDADVAAACALLHNAGIIDEVNREMQTVLDRAGECLDKLPDNAYRQHLRDWLEYVGSRQR